MGKQTVSVDSDESGSNNENADVESEDVDEEPSEEDPLEEDPDEDEPQEENSCEEPEEDPCVPNEDNSHEQELGRVASCEEEPNEMDSCGSPSEDERTGEQNEEPCQEEPFEEDEQCEEEKQNEESCEEEPCEEEKQNEEGGQCEKEMRNMRNEESCEEEPCEEEELCEEEMRNEACEEESYGEEMVEEPREESEEEKQCKEEPLEEEPCEEPEQPSEEEPDEEARDKEAEEEPSEDPEEVSNEGSPVSQSYNRKDAKSTQSNSKKMRISSNIATEPKRTFNTSGIHISPNNVTVPVKLGTTARTGKRRQSKWDVKGEANEPAEGGSNVGTKKRKSRWSNDVPQTSFSSPLKHPVVEIDLKIQKFNAQLLDVDKKLQPGVNDDQLQSERFPSPPPIYNNLGIKINSREARVRSKLMRKKQAIISKLIKKNPNFKPPPDYNTTKLCKKIFAPSKEYPGYNFAGLILGPCGNTVKKLEQETGARIMLHGRGTKFDSFEDLHVLIEADDKYSMDAAVAMVEKLLNPVDDGHNELKHSQLRELAEIRGNLKENYANNSNKPDTCNVCGDTSHPTSSCPLIAPIPGANSNGEKVNFAEIGSGLSPFNAQPPLSVCSIPSMNNSTSHASRPKKVIDNANLYVGCLPQSVDDNALIELFAHFGSLSKVNVIRDWSTNISKGYGFVMYADSMSAAKAVAQMNGVEIDGKVLAVRIAGILPPSSHINQLPSYSGTSVITQNNPHPMWWPGPPESRLPEAVASLSSNRSYPVHHNPFSGRYLGFQNPMPSSLVSGNFATSTELVQFPGYLKSLDSPPLLHRPSMPSDSVPSSQDHFIHNFGCYQMPPT